MTQALSFPLKAGARPGRNYTAAAGVGLCVVLALLAAAAVARIGPQVALVPLGLAAAAFAVARPSVFLPAWICLGLAVDPATIDVTRPLATALWDAPPIIGSALPLKTNAYELFIVLAAVSALAPPALATGRPGRLPGLALAVPVVLLAGLAYGVASGGDPNLAYHEARGLIFASLVFFATWRLRAWSTLEVTRMAVAGTAALGVAVAFRYVFYLQSGVADVPREFWFAHETGLFLSAGFILGVLLLLAAKRDRDRTLAALYTALMLASSAMTGRRSAVLVLIVGAIVLALLLAPRRPVLLAVATVLAAVLGAGYLNAYWDETSGAVAEPARAVRSQVSPDARDASSDQYRRDERENLQRTLEASPVLGIGFGRPFTQYIELPTLEFWPLQSYTPHQNILWTWLKTGIIGASVLLGLWVMALRRCFSASRAASRTTIPNEAIALAAILIMYLVYARIDLALIGSRAAVPLAMAMAIAFARWPVHEGRAE